MRQSSITLALLERCATFKWKVSWNTTRSIRARRCVIWKSVVGRYSGLSGSQGRNDHRVEHIRPPSAETLWSDPRIMRRYCGRPCSHLYTLANRTQIKFICATSMRGLDVRRYFDETITMEMLAKELLEEFIDENHAASLLGDAVAILRGAQEYSKPCETGSCSGSNFDKTTPTPGQHDVVTPIPHKISGAIKFVLRNSFPRRVRMTM